MAFIPENENNPIALIPPIDIIPSALAPIGIIPTALPPIEMIPTALGLIVTILDSITRKLLNISCITLHLLQKI